MRRKHAIYIFLLTGGMIAAYVAWGARSFYLAPKELDYSKLPQEIRAVAPGLVKASGMLEPEPFNGTRLINLLMDPRASERQKLRSTALGKDLILIFRADGIAMTGPRLLFAKDASGWRHITEKEFEAR